MCGLSKVSLDVELQVSTEIDTLDSRGRSALWYAVAKRRHDYVRILLERGADPNTGDPPFLRALSHFSDFVMTETLLDHGAILGPFNETSTMDWWENLFGSDALAIDELLVKRGLDPNHRESDGGTILMRVAEAFTGDFTSPRLKKLIELGCDVEIADEMGMTAIMYAVYCSSSSAFGVLAHAGARVDLKSTNGRTTLHLAVAHRYAWLATEVPRLCELFHDVDLTNLDLDAKDKDGHTVFDLLRIRNGPNWEDYRRHTGIYCSSPSYEEEVEDELKTISALEDLLHYVQEVQGVPEADRYPPLGQYCSRIIEEEPVPGAWPMY